MRTMSDKIGISVSPARLQLLPGGAAPVSVALTNETPVVDQFELQVEGLDPSWFTIAPASLNLFPGAGGVIMLDVHPPEQPAPPAGVHAVQLTVVSRQEARNVATAALALELLPSGAVEPTLAPRRVRTRGTGHFRVVLTNASNEDRVIDLIVSDPEAALEARLKTDRVAIPAGERREVPLAVRPKRRPLVTPPERTYPFTVTLFPAGAEAAEPLGALDGELIYRPPLAFLAPLPPRVRKVALPLAGLLVAAIVAIWIFGDPARRAVAAVTEAAGQALIAAAAQVDPDRGERRDAGGAIASNVTPSPPSARLPVIDRFVLSVPPGAGRGEFELSWEVQGATRVELDGQSQPARGTLRVQALDDREFRLTATNVDGVTVTKSLGVVILRAPEILQFEASPGEVAPGQAVTLTWQARRASQAALEGLRDGRRSVDPSAGRLEVQLDADTTFTLVVENELGRVEQQASVRVIPPASAS